MAAWRYIGVVALGLAPACGLSATGELPSGLDAGQLRVDSGAPKVDAGGGLHVTPDATVGADAGGKKHDGGGGTTHDASHGDATSPPDGSTGADAGDSGSVGDASDAGSTPDAGEDATTSDAGHDAGAHDAGTDSAMTPDAGSGVDASSPPGFCVVSYGCGSTNCGCNQLCDDGTTCGACIPHYGTCGPHIYDCNTDFSSVWSCGGCGNICTCTNPFSVSCSKNASGDYVCGC